MKTYTHTTNDGITKKPVNLETFILDPDSWISLRKSMGSLKLTWNNDASLWEMLNKNGAFLFYIKTDHKNGKIIVSARVGVLSVREA